MRIGELARRTGVSVRLLRYYEEQGLLAPEHREGGHRRYGPDAPLTVGHIRRLLRAGLPTSVIRDVLPCVDGDGQVAPCMLKVLQHRLEELDEQLTTLQESRSALDQIVSAAQEDHLSAPASAPALAG
ncbi:MerR family transcriptional regulator [Micromonospora peucetia]|uniref:DNA-binding transcriptional regulator, MerR family n=1 Tax=Micromonospora peucetia TaxID=47871 RepID=A0A1C6URR3_9ACTN|nr:MerR family transcriptional regulator [Micromonospora peucetia]WSA34713.1 MerR family transcriptional regulator [Micromonospora peucetia]SCL56757.1 DNA-binding transcriptional regulator, MerR family [Micromonospora peucetia]